MQLHYITRRWITRIAFLLLCLVPTVVVIGYATVGQFSSAATKYEQALSERFNLAVKIDHVAHPKPNKTILTGVKFSELGTNLPVASARVIELVQRDETLYIVVSQPEVQGEMLHYWWDITQQLMKLQQQENSQAVRLVVNDVTIVAPGGKQTLVDFLGRIEPTEQGSPETGSIASAEFRIAGMRAKEKITLRVSNHYHDANIESKIHLNTASGSMPCSLLSSILPSLTRLDEAATFQGRIWATQTNERWSGEVSGALREVNLDSLISDQFPHKLSGIADITQLGIKFHDNRVTQAQGELNVTAAGYIGHPLILAAVEHLGLTTSTVLDESQSLMTYKKLAFAFKVTTTGVSLFGRCSESDPSVILTNANGPLLREAREQPKATLSLLRALIPQTDAQVPFSQEANHLLPHLPLPSYKEAGKPRAIMKLRTESSQE